MSLFLRLDQKLAYMRLHPGAIYLNQQASLWRKSVSYLGPWVSRGTFVGSLNRWEEGLGCGCSSVAWIIEWHCTSSHSFCRIYFFGWPAAAPLLGRLPILSKNLTSAKRSRESLREGMLRFFDLGDSMIEPTNDWCNDQFGSSCIMLHDWGGLSHETPERLSTTQNAAHA